MKCFENLRIWQEAHALAIEIYTLTKTFPKDELYGITSQLRRAALSIPTNMAEGIGRETDKDLSHFLIISRGSIMEVKYLLLFSKDTNLVDDSIYTSIVEKLDLLKVGINGFIYKLRSSSLSMKRGA